MLRRQNKMNSDLGMFFRSRFVGKNFQPKLSNTTIDEKRRNLDVIIVDVVVVVVVVDVDILILSRVDKEG